MLKQKPSSLFIVLGWSSISIASLMMQSMYLSLVERIVMWRSWMQCPKLILCSTMVDLSKCFRRICHWCSFNLVSIERPVCPI